MLSGSWIKLQALRPFPFYVCEIQGLGYKNGSFLTLEQTDFGSTRHYGGSSGGQRLAQWWAGKQSTSSGAVWGWRDWAAPWGNGALGPGNHGGSGCSGHSLIPQTSLLPGSLPI